MGSNGHVDPPAGIDPGPPFEADRIYERRVTRTSGPVPPPSCAPPAAGLEFAPPASSETHLSAAAGRSVPIVEGAAGRSGECWCSIAVPPTVEQVTLVRKVGPFGEGMGATKGYR